MIDRANELLREKGYSEAHLAVFVSPLPGKALLKGTRIASPLADSPEVVLRVVEELVPPANELGPLPLRPAELRERLAR